MMMTTECPIDLLCADVFPGVVGTATGELLREVADMPTGAWTAVLLDGVDPAGLPSWDLPAYLTVCGRVQAWAAAMLTTGVAELASRAEVDGADKEVAVALGEPLGAAQRRIWFASRLRRRLPETMRRFRFGDLSQRHAEAMVEVTAPVDDPELAAEVERRALGSLAGKTANGLRKHARRILTRLDPDGVQDRARAARAQADVQFHPGEDGMAGIYAELPVEDGRIVKEAVDAYAITSKQTGDPRPLGVLRTEALTHWASDHLTGRHPTGPAGTTAAPRSGGRPIEIGVVIGLDTALGRDALPGEVPGCGIVPREVIAEMIALEQPTLRALVVDSNGRLTHLASAGYRPTPEQTAQVRATWVTSAGPGSEIFASRCDADHAIPYPDGDTHVDNLIPADRTWHVGKTRTALTVTINPDGSATWNTALGQSHTVTPYDYTLTTPAPNNTDDAAEHTGDTNDE
jgi:hypothetical protein